MKLINFSLILLSTLCFVRNGNGARILAMFPVPAPSHFSMYRGVLMDLANRGHQIDVVSHFPLKYPFDNYRDIIDLNGKMEVMVNTLDFETVSRVGDIAVEEYGAEKAGNDICHILGNPEIQELIKNPPQDPPYDLVIAELFFSSCFFAFGRHLNVPVVAMTSAPTLHYSNEPLGNPLNPAIVPEYEDGSIIHMNFWQRLRNTLFTFNKIRRIRSITEVQNDVVKKYFGSDMPGVRELERDLSLLLVNSHHTLNGIRPMTPAILEVGGIHLRFENVELPADLQNWLDNATSGFIYFSFGTLLKIESLPKEFLAELYSGFSKIAPIRVVMKSTNPEELPPGLPQNVMTLKWLPQIEILRHRNIRGFVTHGGLGGIQEATVFVVPIVGIPIFADQPRNIRNCVERGVAVSLNYREFTADKFVSAINEIIHDPKYKNNMMRLSAQFMDRPMDPRELAIYWIEYIITYGGDSLRSPAVQLTWWQLALLDVYGSIFVAALVTIYVAKLFISALIRRVIRSSKTVPVTKKKN
ncbi:UDP-glucosyltransferase 2-like [Diprion similis]|uniref:UDP-glucosyltransferase 2-like n=1 Tax=Diprion similis TaxID=362088 RepID=UPI001EF9A83C|nr:UDP-glucosyltransferase 2-like [Diprion similis]